MEYCSVGSVSAAIIGQPRFKHSMQMATSKGKQKIKFNNNVRSNIGKSNSNISLRIIYNPLPFTALNIPDPVIDNLILCWKWIGFPINHFEHVDVNVMSRCGCHVRHRLFGYENNTVRCAPKAQSSTEHPHKDFRNGMCKSRIISS